MLNETILIGFISSEMRFSGKDDVMYCKFNLVVPRDYKTDNGTRPADFIPCIAFGLTAEALYTNFEKGNKICVKGRMESSKYEKDGKTRYDLALNVRKWYYMDNKLKYIDVPSDEYAQAFSKVGDR